MMQHRQKCSRICMDYYGLNLITVHCILSLSVFPNASSMVYNFSCFLVFLSFFSYPYVISSLHHQTFPVSVFLEFSFLPFLPVLPPFNKPSPLKTCPIQLFFLLLNIFIICLP